MNKERVLITGISGFIGEELAHACLQKGYEVAGLVRQSFRYNDAIDNLKGKVRLYEGSLNDYARIVNVVADFMPTYVAHLGAITPVSYSFEHPWEVINTNLIGTVNLTEALKKYCPSLKRFIFASCHDNETNVVTEDGIKSITEITKNDKVYSMNLKTREVEIKPIEEIVYQDYEGDMIEYKGKRCNLLVTPNHRMLLQKRKSKKVFFETAETTSQRKSNVAFPIPEWNGYKYDKNIFSFPEVKRHFTAKKEPKTIITKDLFYLIGLFVADGTCDIIEKKRKVKFLRKDREGKRGKNGQFVVMDEKSIIETIHKSYRVRFSVPEKDKARQPLITILKRNGYTFSEYAHEVYFSSYNLYQIFKECGKPAPKKHIPKWCFDYSSSFLELLFNGLLDGDGWGRKTLTTTSKALVENCIELGFRLHKYVSFTRGKYKKVFFKKENRYIGTKSGHDPYRVYFSKTEPFLFTKNIIKKQYKGKVWCLRVPDNHNFLIERHGKVVFSGNSMETYGHQPDMHDRFEPFNEETEQRAACPYAVAKIGAEKYVKYLNFAYKFPGLSLRQTNTYGRKYNDYFVAEAFITAMLKNKDEVNFGNPEPVRNFLYIDDLVQLYLTLFAAPDSVNGESFTVGPPNGITIKELAEQIAKKLNWKGKINWYTREIRDGEIYYLNSDNVKISEVIGWHPKVSLTDGLDKTIKHWKKKLGDN